MPIKNYRNPEINSHTEHHHFLTELKRSEEGNGIFLNTCIGKLETLMLKAIRLSSEIETGNKENSRRRGITAVPSVNLDDVEVIRPGGIHGMGQVVGNSCEQGLSVGSVNRNLRGKWRRIAWT